MRRKEREIKDFCKIKEIIKSSSFMTASFIDDENSTLPYCVPLNFGVTFFEDKNSFCLYFHCAKNGKKLDCIKKNSSVFVNFVSSSKVGTNSLQDEQIACKWTCFYQSVSALCEAENLKDLSEKRKGLDAIMLQNGFFEKTGKKPFYPDIMVDSVCVVRLKIVSFSAKCHSEG